MAPDNFKNLGFREPGEGAESGDKAGKAGKAGSGDSGSREGGAETKTPGELRW